MHLIVLKIRPITVKITEVKTHPVLIAMKTMSVVYSHTSTSGNRTHCNHRTHICQHCRLHSLKRLTLPLPLLLRLRLDGQHRSLQGGLVGLPLQEDERKSLQQHVVL